MPSVDQTHRPKPHRDVRFAAEVQGVLDSVSQTSLRLTKWELARRVAEQTQMSTANAANILSGHLPRSASARRRWVRAVAEELESYVARAGGAFSAEGFLARHADPDGIVPRPSEGLAEVLERARTRARERDAVGRPVVSRPPSEAARRAVAALLLDGRYAAASALVAGSDPHLADE